jgi:hypothetical protein
MGVCPPRRPTEGRRTVEGGLPTRAESTNLAVAAGECQFLWRGAITILCGESSREPLRFARILFSSTPGPPGVRTERRCRRLWKRILCCPPRAGTAPLGRTGDGGMSSDGLFRFSAPFFVQCAFLAASSYTRPGGLAT